MTTPEHDHLPAWKSRLAAAWVLFVFFSYMGTIALERGERIWRMIESFL